MLETMTTTSPGDLGVYAILAPLAVIVMVLVVLALVNRRRSTAQSKRSQPVRIPHKSGPVIAFPSRRVRWMSRWRARKLGRFRHYRGRLWPSPPGQRTPPGRGAPGRRRNL